MSIPKDLPNLVALPLHPDKSSRHLVSATIVTSLIVAGGTALMYHPAREADLIRKRRASPVAVFFAETFFAAFTSITLAILFWFSSYLFTGLFSCSCLASLLLGAPLVVLQYMWYLYQTISVQDGVHLYGITDIKTMFLGVCGVCILCLFSWYFTNSLVPILIAMLAFSLTRACMLVSYSRK